MKIIWKEAHITRKKDEAEEKGQGKQEQQISTTSMMTSLTNKYYHKLINLLLKILPLY